MLSTTSHYNNPFPLDATTTTTIYVTFYDASSHWPYSESWKTHIFRHTRWGQLLEFLGQPNAKKHLVFCMKSFFSQYFHKLIGSFSAEKLLISSLISPIFRDSADEHPIIIFMIWCTPQTSVRAAQNVRSIARKKCQFHNFKYDEYMRSCYCKFMLFRAKSGLHSHTPKKPVASSCQNATYAKAGRKNRNKAPKNQAIPTWNCSFASGQCWKKTREKRAIQIFPSVAVIFSPPFQLTSFFQPFQLLFWGTASVFV